MSDTYFSTNDKVKIWYSFHKGEKDCLVFLSGITGSSSAWDPISSFFKKYSIVTMDYRGHGLSDKPVENAKYSISLIAEDLKHILDEYKIKKVILGGYYLRNFTKDIQAMSKRWF